MMGDLIPLTFEKSSVRVVMIKDAPWFVAFDVGRVLGYRNIRDATARLDDDEKMMIRMSSVAISDGITSNPLNSNEPPKNPDLGTSGDKNPGSGDPVLHRSALFWDGGHLW